MGQSRPLRHCCHRYAQAHAAAHNGANNQTGDDPHITARLNIFVEKGAHDGHEHTERLSDGDECRQWLEAFEQNMPVQHWTGRSGPIILPYGWPNKRLS